MTNEEHIKYWLDSAERDMESAEVNYKSKQYGWCLFIGHLVLEKVLKAHFIISNNDLVPPKIHDLLKLASKSSIQLSKDQAKFYELVTRFNIAARYMEYKDDISKNATKENSKEILNRIKKEYEWLKFQIKY